MARQLLLCCMTSEFCASITFHCFHYMRRHSFSVHGLDGMTCHGTARHHLFHQITIQYNKIQYKTAQYCTVNYNTVRSIAAPLIGGIDMQHSALRYTTVRHTAPPLLRSCTARGYTTLRNTARCSTTLHETTHYGTFPASTVYYVDIHYTSLCYAARYISSMTFHYTYSIPPHSKHITLHQLPYTTLHRVAMHFISLRCVALACISLHYIASHCIDDIFLTGPAAEVQTTKTIPYTGLMSTNELSRPLIHLQAFIAKDKSEWLSSP